MIKILNDLKLIDRNTEWIGAPRVSIWHKTSYYAAIILCYVQLILTKNKCIKYLGKDYIFDNPATPLNLQNYPFEIGMKILKNMDRDPKKVLDAGANTGQFACTLAAMVPGVIIHSFEPNPQIAKILQKNLEVFSNRSKVFEYAISNQSSTETLYFEKNRSAIGSIIRANASEDSKKITQISIRATSQPEKLTKIKSYDLIKVDVEGLEDQAILGLRGVRTRYLFIEISGSGRTKNFLHSELFDSIKRTLGPFEITYIDQFTYKNANFEILLKFV